jgi:hypothetical protein
MQMNPETPESERCPVCNRSGTLYERLCKTICSACRSIIRTCSDL